MGLFCFLKPNISRFMPTYPALHQRGLSSAPRITPPLSVISVLCQCGLQKNVIGLLGVMCVNITDAQHLSASTHVSYTSFDLLLSLSYIKEGKITNSSSWWYIYKAMQPTFKRWSIHNFSSAV